MPLVLDTMPALAAPHSLMLNWVRKPSMRYGRQDWTVEELAAQTGWSPQIVEERMAQLADHGMVRESGTRICCVTGRNGQAWTAAV